MGPYVAGLFENGAYAETGQHIMTSYRSKKLLVNQLPEGAWILQMMCYFASQLIDNQCRKQRFVCQLKLRSAHNISYDANSSTDIFYHKCYVIVLMQIESIDHSFYVLIYWNRVNRLWMIMTDHRNFKNNCSVNQLSSYRLQLQTCVSRLLKS